jgi:hypothetical protein
MSIHENSCNVRECTTLPSGPFAFAQKNSRIAAGISDSLQNLEGMVRRSTFALTISASANTYIQIARL